MHSIRPLLRAVLLAIVLAIAWFGSLAATAACVVRQVGSPPEAGDPAERLAELDEQHRLLEESGALRDHRLAGRPRASLGAWLEESRRVVDELAERRRANPRPVLDRSQGFALLLPHLAPMRAETRIRAVLVEDAAIRGDVAGLRTLLDGTVALAADSARDHILVSSLVATAQADAVASSIDGLLDLGLVDPTVAADVLASTAPLAEPATYAFAEAAIGEGAMLRTEFDRLRELSPEERRLWTAQFGGDFSAIADDDLLRADAYQSALAEAVSNPDREAAKAAIAELDVRAAAGEFGDLVKMLAPSFGPAFDRLDRMLARMQRQRELLAAIADGRASPADGANAAAFLLRAALEATTLAPAAQADLEAVRTLGAAAPAESLEATRRELRTTLDRIATALEMAARCRRCDFSRLLARDATLVPGETAAIAGAVRALLAIDRITTPDDDTPGATDDPVPSAGDVAGAATDDAVVTAIAVVAHLSNGERLAHALAAQSVARDLADAVARSTAPPAAVAARRAAALALLRRDDPFGFRAALDAERTRLVRTMVEFPAPDADGPAFAVRAFDPARIESLSPNHAAFLLAVVSPPNDATPAETCACPFDGPMLSVVRWFDRPALATARAQEPRLRAQLAREIDAGRLAAESAPDQSPLAGLVPTTPVDVATRIVEAAEDLARLDRLLAPRSDRATP
jgi:hypothetical protein